MTTFAVYTNATTTAWCTSTSATALPDTYFSPYRAISTTATSTTSINVFGTAPGTYYVNGDGTNWQVLHTVVKPVKPKFDKRSRDRVRGSIKRALKLMFDIGFEEEARIFLKGDCIEVSHPDSLLKFVIQKSRYGTIESKTRHIGVSVPYQLDLYTKCDKHVADLCVYLKDTPVLDQVLGVAMYIKSGSEEMILKQANWRQLSSDMELRQILALEYPYLEDKLRLNTKRIDNSVRANYINANPDRFIQADATIL